QAGTEDQRHQSGHQMQEVVAVGPAGDRQQVEIPQETDHGGQRVDTTDCDVQSLVADRSQRERPQEPECAKPDVHDVVVWVDEKEPEKLVIRHLGEVAEARDEEPDNPAHDVDSTKNHREVLLGCPIPSSTLELDPELLFWSYHA